MSVRHNNKTNAPELATQHEMVLNAFTYTEWNIFSWVIEEMKVKTIENYCVIYTKIAKINKLINESFVLLRN